jgi:hypothetical protein
MSATGAIPSWYTGNAAASQIDSVAVLWSRCGSELGRSSNRQHSNHADWSASAHDDTITSLACVDWTLEAASQHRLMSSWGIQHMQITAA